MKSDVAELEEDKPRAKEGNVKCSLFNPEKAEELAIPDTEDKRINRDLFEEHVDLRVPEQPDSSLQEATNILSRQVAPQMVWTQKCLG